MEELRSAARFCFACGWANPRGLHLQFALRDGVAVAAFVPQPEHQGYPGLLHGGLIAAILDEALGWTTYGRGLRAVTAKLTVRIREPVRIGQPVEVRGWTTRERRRWLEGRAQVRTADGHVLAEAEGILVPVPPDLALEIERSNA